MSRSAPHVVFAGGGTGGHLFSGLAVAEELRRDWPQVRISFAGSGKEFEQEHVREAGFAYWFVPCRPLPKRPLEVPRFLADSLRGYLAARQRLRRQPAACVVGLGGYASVPVARAAAQRRIALVLLEQNAVPGRATRWLASSARSLCLAMDEARRCLSPQCPVLVTGNPVRRGFLRACAERSCGNRPRKLLVLGGSSGARALNESVPQALAALRPRLCGWQIVHQSGTADAEATRRRYAALGLEAAVLPFITDMPATLGNADLAVSRAGGTTLAELAVAGVPAVLLPYPHAADDHQRKNAEVVARQGAGMVVDQREPPGPLHDRLARVIGPLLTDPERRAAMSHAMQRIARPDAARQIADLVIRHTGERSMRQGAR